MFMFELTPNAVKIPQGIHWQPTIVNLMDVNYLINTARAFSVLIPSSTNVDVVIDSSNIYNNNINHLFNKLIAAHYPLTKLITDKISKEYLNYWELYSLIFKTIKIKNDEFTSFHFNDPHKNSINTLTKFLPDIKHKWYATYKGSEATYNDRSRWSKGVEANGELTTANIRSWTNLTTIHLKYLDLIVINNDNQEYDLNSIFASLMMLKTGGNAVINIVSFNKILSTSMLSIIYLFANCFNKSEIVRTTADDRVYLCGYSYRSELTIKNKMQLVEYIEENNVGTNRSLFEMHKEFREFISTVEHIFDVILGDRYRFYNRIVQTYNDLVASLSSKTFDNYLDDYINSIPDVSNDWITETGWKNQ